MASSTTANGEEKPWFLKSTHPVGFPECTALTASKKDQEAFIRSDVDSYRENQVINDGTIQGSDHVMVDAPTESSFTMIPESVTGETFQEISAENADVAEATSAKNVVKTSNNNDPHPFMTGLLEHGQPKSSELLDLENKMLTENKDVAFSSSKNALVDLFYEMEEVVSAARLRDILEAAWKQDPLSTLKIIFNARSIHLGKSSRAVFYRAAGWLAENHPLTLIENLRWLTQPVIEKKKAKMNDEEPASESHKDLEKDEDDPSAYNVQYGLSHGYWKDILNILVLAANGKLTVLSQPSEILNPNNSAVGPKPDWNTKLGRKRACRKIHREIRKKRFQTQQEVESKQRKETEALIEHFNNVTQAKLQVVLPKATPQGPTDWKVLKHERRDDRHEQVISQFSNNAVYRGLHLTVTRLFADQLTLDLKALRGVDSKAKKEISLAGKWAPSAKHFHDSHTWIASSIAEIMYPRANINDISPTDDRETYLKYAREEYRKDISALRKHLDVVERNISACTFGNIKYDRLPSRAMVAHTKTFIQKDLENFEKYLEDVASGKAKISGATLLPSECIKAVDTSSYGYTENSVVNEKKSMKEMVKAKELQVKARAINGMWNTIVQRVKASGTLSSSIAVCDVSGSMTHPFLPDGTVPRHSAIGLSLLIAEVTKPPFGGAFITFSEKPEVVKVDLTQTLEQKYRAMAQAKWDMSTNFVSVFEDLILPMAIEKKIKPEDMVKRVFVFSDMHFNAAENERGKDNNRRSWTSSYERIKAAYEKAGYEMPELIFWNLAGGRNNGIAPKPVDADTPGTALVSGYSQGMLKALLENGGFEEEDEDTLEEEVMVMENGETVDVKPTKKKNDSVGLMKKAIGHEAYDMLKIVD